MHLSITLLLRILIRPILDHVLIYGVRLSIHSFIHSLNYIFVCLLFVYYQSLYLHTVQVRHMTEIRKGFDPRDSIPKLEEEIQGEIAFALGKTGTKCTLIFRSLRALDAKITASRDDKEKEFLIHEFNEVRLVAHGARRDLVIDGTKISSYYFLHLDLRTAYFFPNQVIHRQACGFTWHNQKLIEEEFPIPPKKIL